MRMANAKGSNPQRPQKCFACGSDVHEREAYCPACWESLARVATYWMYSLATLTAFWRLLKAK